MYYLYHKIHNETGMNYLGHTKRDPEIYQGSGKYWKRHLEKHNNNVTTKILCKSDNIADIIEKGKFYSNLWNIVESPFWANLKIEEGDGGFNQKQVKETLIKKYGVDNPMKVKEISDRQHAKSKQTLLAKYGVDNATKHPTVKNKIKNTFADPIWQSTIGIEMKRKQQKIKDSKEWKIKTGALISEKKNDPVWKASQLKTCVHCNKQFMPTNLKRWHGENCKLKPNQDQ